MNDPLIGILITILVLCIIVYAVHLLISFLKLPDPIDKIAYLVVAVVVLVILLHRFGVVAVL